MSQYYNYAYLCTGVLVQVATMYLKESYNFVVKTRVKSGNRGNNKVSCCTYSVGDEGDEGDEGGGWGLGFGVWGCDI